MPRPHTDVVAGFVIEGHGVDHVRGMDVIGEVHELIDLGRDEARLTRLWVTLEALA